MAIVCIGPTCFGYPSNRTRASVNAKARATIALTKACCNLSFRGRLPYDDKARFEKPLNYGKKKKKKHGSTGCSDDEYYKRLAQRKCGKLCPIYL